MSRIRLLAFASAIILAALGVGCLDPGPAATAPTNQDPGPGEPAPPPIDVPDADLKALVEGNNQFAIELYQKLAEKHDGNIVLSPYSISSALAMTYAGARGETAEQMAKTLHFPNDPTQVQEEFGKTTRLLNSGGTETGRVEIANAVWVAEGLNIAEPFTELMKRHHNAGLQRVNFAEPSAAVQKINVWVAARTHEKIPAVLGAGDLSPDTRLVLANAAYFKGRWAAPFLANQTKEEKFEANRGKEVTVQMMRREEHTYKYYSNAEFQLVELPYRDNGLSMLVLLPIQRSGLEVVTRSLTATKLKAAIAKLSECKGSVFLPRFRFESRFGLGAHLRQMGMPAAFSNSADFSGIVPAGMVRLSDAVHAGYIEVEERGTEAAGATAVVMTPFSHYKGPPPPRFTFRADHPFLFIVTDRMTGVMLFIGRYAGPM